MTSYPFAKSTHRPTRGTRIGSRLQSGVDTFRKNFGTRSFKLLRNRKRALTNAALVCQRWRDSVLPYLYAVLTVDASWYPKSFLAFFNFLRQNTSITGYIKELRLAGPYIEEGVCDFNVETFATILPMLTSLHTLSIKQIALRVPESISRIVATDPRYPFALRKLTVSGCGSAESTGYLDTFADFFSLFNADTLEVEELLVPGPVDRDKREFELAAWRPERLISTQNLVFGGGLCYTRTRTAIDAHGFFARLLRPGVLRAMSSSFNAYHSLTTQQFRVFLRSAPAQSIVSIDLHLVTLLAWYSRVDDWETLGRALSSCTCLRNLRVDIPGFLKHRPGGYWQRSVLSTILRLAPSSIQGRVVPLLESVIIELDCPRHKALKEAMLPILPRLRAAGLLQEVFASAPLERINAHIDVDDIADRGRASAGILTRTSPPASCFGTPGHICIFCLP
ncbi:hypothetical protein C8T65DRAFT_696861 [Cerioporus squamosus]|nr:hypothetical protein C8T65DRAFT_696861 [Cerioporus squamosus]